MKIPGNWRNENGSENIVKKKYTIGKIGENPTAPPDHVRHKWWKYCQNIISNISTDKYEYYNILQILIIYKQHRQLVIEEVKNLMIKNSWLLRAVSAWRVPSKVEPFLLQRIVSLSVPDILPDWVPPGCQTMTWHHQPL